MSYITISLCEQVHTSIHHVKHMGNLNTVMEPFAKLETENK